MLKIACIYISAIFQIINFSESLKNRTNDEKLPDKHDIEGGAHGLIRLWSQYR